MKKINNKKIGIAVVITLVLIAILLIVTKSSGNVGKAFFVEGNLPEVIDLVNEETLIFRELPTNEEGLTIRVKSSIELYGSQSYNFDLKLFPKNDGDYRIEIYRVPSSSTNSLAGPLLREETLDINGDRFTLYLDEEDTIPDLEFNLQNNQLFVTNLHFLTPELFRVSLLDNLTGEEYGRLIRVDENDLVQFKLNTSAPVYLTDEELTFSLQTDDGLRIADTINFTHWDTPSSLFNRTANLTLEEIPESISLLLKVAAKFGGGESYRFFKFAIGTEALEVNNESYPKIKVTFTDDDLDVRTADLEVTFRATTELQPFGLPCRLSNADANLYSSSWFKDSGIDKIYAYDAVDETPLQSAAAAPIGEITKLEQFKGYFVKLSEASETKLTFEDCEVEDPRLVVRLNPPSVENIPPQNTYKIRRGWNLFSMPGVVPISMTELSGNNRFELFECILGEDCKRLGQRSHLKPGRAYWVHSNSEFTVSLE